MEVPPPSAARARTVGVLALLAACASATFSGCKIDDRTVHAGAAGAGSAEPIGLIEPVLGGSGAAGAAPASGGAAGNESPPVPALVTMPLPSVPTTRTADAGDVAPPPAASAATSVLAVSAAQIRVGETAVLQLAVHDALGLPLGRGGDVVAFSVSGGDAEGRLDPVVDHGDGTYTVLFTGTLGGTPLTVGATLNGASVSTPGPVLRVVRYSNRVLSFDGTSEYLSVADLVLPTGSLSLWLQTAASDGYLISKVQAGGSSEGELRLLLSGGRALFRVEGTEVNEILSDSLLDDSRWHHLLVSFNPGLSMFVDGVLQSDQNVANTTGMQATGTTLEIGRNNALENGYYAGLLDEIAFYSRALGPAEVRDLEASGAPGDLKLAGTAAALSHWWRLGESDVPPTLFDSAGTLDATMVQMGTLNVVTVQR
jgi:hypothetical protein